MKKPNIIVIFSDQQRWDTLGCYGQELPVTPNLDELARDGVMFENAFTVNPVCGPTRSTMQTGLYPTETGCFRNDIILPQGQKTVAHFLSDEGYSVGYVGKWHLASNNTAHEGFVVAAPTESSGEIIDNCFTAIPKQYRGGYKDFWIASDILEGTSHGYGGHMFDIDGNKVSWDEDVYRADFLTDLTTDYIDNYQEEEPFFLFLSYLEPHHQNDRKTYEGPHGSQEKWSNFKVPGDLEPFVNGDWAEEYPDYLGCCNNLDQNVGKIRQAIKDKGLDDNTIIVYLSDHGSHFKTRNGEYKRSCHDSSIRIPFVIYDPRARAGQVIDDHASIIDVVPTLLKAAGIKVPSYMQGQPLQDLYIDKAKRSNVSFIQISESQIGRAIRTDTWTYSVAAPDQSGLLEKHSEVYQEEFLYNLVDDPNQLENLVTSEDLKPVKEMLRKLLLEEIYRIEGKKPEIMEV
ncbi:sulfatase-like hydrolase/transferase [Vibrio hippocampi]|uniref:Ulvan-active sulfatase n=1 Tax=Vibrio hippocampi TaxID=654686 RepID=A0ABM8ZL95_9VIBR|nr:sulfatase-like hydrolase/transferase [Vibrio hippocampi]CAH0528797.1 Ulvan-active sulfatase [Vibrio hippocampi]